MGFPRPEYWSGLPSPSSGALPSTGIEPAFRALAGRFFTTEPPGKLVRLFAAAAAKSLQSCPTLCVYLMPNSFVYLKLLFFPSLLLSAASCPITVLCSSPSNLLSEQVNQQYFVRVLYLRYR